METKCTDNARAFFIENFFVCFFLEQRSIMYTFNFPIREST